MAPYGTKTISLEEKNWLHQLQEAPYQGKLIVYHDFVDMPSLETAVEPVLIARTDLSSSAMN